MKYSPNKKEAARSAWGCPFGFLMPNDNPLKAPRPSEIFSGFQVRLLPPFLCGGILRRAKMAKDAAETSLSGSFMRSVK
jgi:hypothetical protein